MKTLLAIVLALALPAGIQAAGCTGAANCKVCKSCERCGHCWPKRGKGGSCGVIAAQKEKLRKGRK